MKARKFLLYPERQLFLIEELEQRLQYKHTAQIRFETIEEAEEIRQKGMKQESQQQSQARDLGEKYHPLILSSYIPDVSIRWVHKAVGYGLFAEEPILESNYVGEYTGVVRKNNRRYFEPLNNYCYEYPAVDEIGRSYVIDATEGCLTRFINYSASPNLKPIYAYWEGYYHLIFVALCKIMPGDQFSYDYGESYWRIREKPKNITPKEFEKSAFGPMRKFFGYI